MSCSGDRNFSRCTVCGALFENENERWTTCAKHRKPKLPRVPIPPPRRVFRTRKNELARKAKHRTRPELES